MHMCTCAQGRKMQDGSAMGMVPHNPPKMLWGSSTSEMSLTSVTFLLVLLASKRSPLVETQSRTSHRSEVRETWPSDAVTSIRCYAWCSGAGTGMRLSQRLALVKFRYIIGTEEPDTIMPDPSAASRERNPGRKSVIHQKQEKRFITLCSIPSLTVEGPRQCL